MGTTTWGHLSLERVSESGTPAGLQGHSGPLPSAKDPSAWCREHPRPRRRLKSPVAGGYAAASICPEVRGGAEGTGVHVPADQSKDCRNPQGLGTPSASPRLQVCYMFGAMLPPADSQGVREPFKDPHLISHSMTPSRKPCLSSPPLPPGPRGPGSQAAAASQADEAVLAKWDVLSQPPKPAFSGAAIKGHSGCQCASHQTA